jgi:hypothetical protein
MPQERMSADEFRASIDAANPDLAKARANATESEVQSSIVKALKRAGYIVQSTSQRRASKVSIGLADLLVTHRDWRGFWRAIEVKKPTGYHVSPEQAALVAINAVTIVTSAAQALEVCREAAKVLATNGR